VIVAATNVRGDYHILRLALKSEIVDLEKLILKFLGGNTEYLCAIVGKCSAP
jgi:hypothetical protein